MWVDQVDPGAVRTQQPRRLVHAELEDRRQVGRGADPGGDLAQGSFDVRALRVLAPGRIQRLDESDVPHRGGSMVRERTDEPDLGRREGIATARERSKGPVDGVPGDQGRHDHRTDANVAHDAIRFGCVIERWVVEVVAGDHDAALRHGPAEHSDPDRQVDRSDPLPAPGAVDAGVVGEPQPVRLGIEEVDHRAIRVEKSGGLVDRGRQQVVDVAVTAIGILPAVEGAEGWFRDRD
jgi:hypothetical protein